VRADAFASRCHPATAGALARGRGARGDARRERRAATGVAADPEYEETPAAVPVRTVRHCEAVLWYTLAQECGAEAEPYRTGWQNAEMWLRQSYVTVRTRGDARPVSLSPLILVDPWPLSTSST
jgi:hypothetical protein